VWGFPEPLGFRHRIFREAVRPLSAQTLSHIPVLRARRRDTWVLALLTCHSLGPNTKAG